jgi:hypothetical protein
LSIERVAVRRTIDAGRRGRREREEYPVRYMLLLYVSERPEPGTPEAAEAFGAIRAFHQDCAERGVLVASDPLEPPATATTVRVSDGGTIVSDGPFVETKEWLGGYFLVDCASEEEALELAARCPTARDGSVEVRPVVERPEL